VTCHSGEPLGDAPERGEPPEFPGRRRAEAPNGAATTGGVIWVQGHGISSWLILTGLGPFIGCVTGVVQDSAPGRSCPDLTCRPVLPAREVEPGRTIRHSIDSPPVENLLRSSSCGIGARMPDGGPLEGPRRFGHTADPAQSPRRRRGCNSTRSRVRKCLARRHNEIRGRNSAHVTKSKAA
jgi:hypothetical protein